MAGATVKIEGLDKVTASLSDAIGKIRDRTAEGIALAGQFVKGEAQSLTSVDMGVLQNSAFSKMAGDDSNPVAVVGYTAEYAPHVHEMPEGTKWNRPGAESKFLEKAVTRNLSAIINIIARTAAK